MKPITRGQFEDIEQALGHLTLARGMLRGAGCPEAAKAVTRAIKSTEGAKRHGERRMMHSPRPERRHVPVRLPECHRQP
jgi:hypothetical protein